MFTSSSKLLRSCKQSIETKRKNHHSKIHIITDLLGVSQWQAKYLISKNSINSRYDDKLLVESIKYCQSLYSNDEILKNSELVGRHPVRLENHYLTMKEGGFYPIKANILSKSIYYMRQNVKKLKDDELIPQDVDVAKSFLTYVHDQELGHRIYEEYKDSSVWNQIHLSLLQRFLRYRLNITDEKILEMFMKYKMVKNKSFSIIQENITIAESLGFEPQKIIQYGYLLYNNPKYPKRTLEEFSNLAGADMRKCMRLYPKLVVTPPSNFAKTYGILKSYDISDEAIRNGMNVFSLNPDTVKLRLSEIENNSDLRPLLKLPHVIRLIVHHNRARSRLSYLQQLNFKCACSTILHSDNSKRVEQFARDGTDVICIKDLTAFLQQIFGVDADKLSQKLKRHPFYLHVPLKNMQETYDFLIRSHFKSPNVYRVIYILLYPSDKIKTTMKTLKKAKQPQFDYKSLNLTDKLNLILYTIEKEHHFTGNGIWDQKNLPEVS